MKKPLFILALAAAVSPMLDAKVYSCGAGCYSDKAKGARGHANLGKQIGSYTGVTSHADEVVTAEATTPDIKKTAVAAAAPTRPAARSVPRPVAVNRHTAPRSAPFVPVTLSRPKASPPLNTSTRLSGRRSILEQELSNERNALASAQKALAEGRIVNNGVSGAAHQSRIRQLESVVLDRQQNIQALQRELSRM